VPEKLKSEPSAAPDPEKMLNEISAAAGICINERAILPVSALVFSKDLLEYCKTNACGNYNKSWTCPPACGDIEEHKKKILSCKKMLVFTTKHNLDDSFDYDGMTRGRKLHTLLTTRIKDGFGGALVYGAGCCPVCSSCAFPEPCAFPDRRIGSIEAAGIDVTQLAGAAGIAYNNGTNTVTYFTIAFL